MSDLEDDDPVWQDDPPFAVGETQIAPATDEEIARLDSNWLMWTDERTVPSLISRIKAEREQTIRECAYIADRNIPDNNLRMQVIRAIIALLQSSKET